MASTNLAVTLDHAIAFLTGPLLASYSAATIIKLQALLEANLTAVYAPTWSAHQPLRGSARIRWSDWIDALGGLEFEFFVDPGCVAIRRAGELTTVWTGTVAAPPLPTPRTGLASFSDAQNRLCSRKTAAQQLLEHDDEDEKIFDLINDASWGPVFPEHRSSSPLSTISSPYSRCSSRSSNSSSSVSETTSQSSSPSSSYSSQSKQSNGSSRRERARHARVYVDTSKTDVTPYDGGKTTVLTGGVMLGGGSNKASSHKPKQHSSSGSWRSGRA
ncbi:hypothetical protein H1R20_g8205, partial [Candolleomyces eurysporus]